MFWRQLLFKDDSYKALTQNEEKDKCSLWDVSVVLDSPATIFAHDVIFTYTISVMYVRIRSCGLCCVIAANGL